MSIKNSDKYEALQARVAELETALRQARDHGESLLALRASEELARENAGRFKATLDAAPIIIWAAYDRECRAIYGNQVARELCRVGESANMSKSGPEFESIAHFRIFKDGKELAPDEMPIQIVAKTGIELRDYAMDFVFDDGTGCSLLGNVVPVFDSEGNPSGAIAAFVDITSQVRSRRALFESEERFRLAMKGANDGLYDWNIQTGEIYYSPRWKSMLGYAEDELDPHLDTWKNLLHPDDLGPSLARKHGFINAKKDQIELEFRMRHKDGHYLNILSRALYIWDNGRLIRIIGTHVDITELRKAEEALREKSAALKEVNAALKVLLKQREEDKKKLGESVSASIRNLISPYVKELKNTPLTNTQRTWIRILESHFGEITSEFGTTSAAKYSNLSPSEVRIADLIKDGKATAEIAELLKISEKTVCRHRDNLRNKLGLRGSRANLRTYLLSRT